MNTETLLHLNYLNRVFILVNKENYGDYSLHVKVGTQVERKVFKELDGTAKERLAAYLITIERYYLFLEKKETGHSEEEIKWDESYVQLVQFIETLLPAYNFRLAYLQRESLEKEGNKWVSTYIAYVVNTNQLKEKMTLFRLTHQAEEQQVEWVVSEAYLKAHYPHFEAEFIRIKEDEMLAYKYETNPDIPHLFEGFDDLID